MVYTTDGLVIRSRELGDNDRLVTILTAERGQVTVIAKGARSMKSKFLNTTQPFVYGNFEISTKGNYSYLRDGSSYELFYRLRDDVEKLFLATYVCDVAYEVTGEDVPSPEILKLTLNTLYAIMKELRPIRLIKAVFELRAAGYSGYMPDLSACERCGEENIDNMYFDIMNGNLICSKCLNIGAGKQSDINELYERGDIRERNVLIPLTPAALVAVRYALTSLPEKIFSFNLSEKDDLERFSKIGEEYLLHHLERGFESLELYYSVI